MEFVLKKSEKVREIRNLKCISNKWICWRWFCRSAVVCCCWSAAGRLGWIVWSTVRWTTSDSRWTRVTCNTQRSQWLGNMPFRTTSRVCTAARKDIGALNGEWEYLYGRLAAKLNMKVELKPEFLMEIKQLLGEGTRNRIESQIWRILIFTMHWDGWCIILIV